MTTNFQNHVETVDAQTIKMIMFSIGEQEYCIPILSVREIREFGKTTPLPFAPHYVRGAINLRGTILTVVDLASYLNIEPQENNERRVVIIVEAKNGLVCGMLVDKVIDMADVRSQDIQSVSEDNNSLNGLVSIDDRMIGALHLENVVNALVGYTISE